MPRRVVYLAWAPFFSGAERAMLLTVTHLDPVRYVPHVVVGSDGETLAALHAAGVSCETQPLAHLDRRRPLAWMRSVWGLIQKARRQGASLIHANDAPSFQPGGYAAKVLRIPALAHVRFPDTHEGFSWFLRSDPARALFVSDYLRADATAASPATFVGRSDVLYDGVLIPEALSEAARLALRRSLELPEDSVVVALTGQISEIKGIWEFVEAARVLVARGVAATFAVLGDDLKGQGVLRRSMEDRVAELGLSAHFRFLGFRTDAPHLIAAFDIVAVPSHVEPLGNATLEAMAAGVPVVGSRVGGIPEMVVDSETGLLVPSRDPVALAGALQTLVESAEMRAEFGRAARARAESRFSLREHAGRLQDVYDTLLGRAR